jgi:GDPmannose 4,6-dehydratase
MWLMLQQNIPQDFVIATGEMHSIREFVEKAFKHIGKTIIWEGKGLNEVGKEESTNVVRVKVNAKYFRPTEVVSKLFYHFNSILLCSTSHIYFN